MTKNLRIRPDNRLKDGPMVPVTCTACTVSVLVRKSSWDQTSVQWHGDEARECLERKAFEARPGIDSRFLGCADLAAAVERAAVSGTVPVLQEELGIPKSLAAAQAARQ